MTEDEREILLDIFENTESPNKVKITFDPISRDVTIVYEDCDDEWFLELQSAQQKGVFQMKQTTDAPSPKSKKNITRAQGKNILHVLRFKLLAIFLQLIGYGILIYIDWRIALGAFLLHWAINIECRARR